MREEGGRHELASTPAHSHADPVSSGDGSPSSSPLGRRVRKRSPSRSPQRVVGRGERMREEGTTPSTRACGRANWAEPGHVRPLSPLRIGEANADPMPSGDESSSCSPLGRRGRKRSASRSPQRVVESCGGKRRSCRDRVKSARTEEQDSKEPEAKKARTDEQVSEEQQDQAGASSTQATATRPERAVEVAKEQYVHEHKESENNRSSDNVVIQCYDSAPLLC